MGKRNRRSSSSEEYDEHLERRLKRLKRRIRKRKERKSRHRKNRRETSESSDSDQSSNYGSINSEIRSDEISERSETEGKNLQNPEGQADMPISTKENEEEFCLSEDILKMIGKRVCEDRTLSSAIQSNVALRWQDILNQGLPNDDKLQLIKKYPPPENCKLCDPPKLNPEIKTIIQEPVLNRDTRILLKQSKLTSGLAAMGKAMTLTLKQGQSEENLKILECLGDAGSLLADLQHDESTIRRSLILANINPTLKSVLKETQADEFLFSNILDEVVKATKALETASKDLRPKNKDYPNKIPKNSKLPPRQYRTDFAATSGGQKQYQREAPSQRRHTNYQRSRLRKEQHQQQQNRRRRY